MSYHSVVVNGYMCIHSDESPVFIIPLAQRSCWGIHWFPSVRPSVRPTSRVRSVAPAVFGNFLKFVTLTLSSFDLGSDLNH